MPIPYILFAFMIQFGILLSCTQTPASVTPFQKLSVLDIVKSKPKAGEWLATHQEKKQSLASYIGCKPNKINDLRNILYYTVIGECNPQQKKIITLVSNYLAIVYQVQLIKMPDINTSIIPTKWHREHLGFHQINSQYILDTILANSLPKDAFGIIAFTTHDLYPAQNWNFVFGQASLKKRVGVWSLARLNHFNEHIFAKRTMQVAVHEVGHMFGINHCINYECTMNGSNSIQESDGQPMWMCTICMSKLAWNRGLNFATYFQDLELFWTKNMAIDSNSYNYYKAVNSL